MNTRQQYEHIIVGILLITVIIAGGMWIWLGILAMLAQR